ncbi:hypothetical protein H6F88_20960 [Oculatella sp. FACHB-28]|nr:hypothetical protein [Oculatella sp. FACHB-28]
MRNVNRIAGMAMCWFPLAIAPALALAPEVQADLQTSSIESAEMTAVATSDLDLVTSEAVTSEIAELDAISQVEVPQSAAIANPSTLPPLGEAADLGFSGELTQASFTEASFSAIASNAEAAEIGYTVELPEIEAIAQTSPSPESSEPQDSDDSSNSDTTEQVDLDSETIENSPVLQRWLEDIPDVLSEIRSDPSFRTRLRLGYSQFPSTDQAGGFNVGIEDVFIGQTGLTVSADYQATFEGDRQAYGADLRYYIRPLGSYINVAPVIGYRYLETDEYTTDDLNLGLRFLLALSRTGAADISLTQTWVAPGRDEEVGITTLSVGYALTEDLRISTDIQKQNSSFNKDSRVGIVLEWML